MTTGKVYATILAIPLIAACAAQPVMRPEPRISLDELARSADVEREPRAEAEEPNAAVYTAQGSESSTENNITETLKKECEQVASTEHLLVKMIERYQNKIEEGYSPKEAAKETHKDAFVAYPMMQLLCGHDPLLKDKFDAAVAQFDAYAAGHK